MIPGMEILLVTARSGSSVRLSGLNSAGGSEDKAGGIRREIELVVSGGVDGVAVGTGENRMLEVGVKVRVIRVPYFGEFGTITALPYAHAEIESGALLRVAG